MDIGSLREEYTDEKASKYEKKRVGSIKWEMEQNSVQEILEDLVSTNTINSVLDVPVGTGRFIPLYQKLGLRAIGVDASEDMLDRAAQKVTNENVLLKHQDILSYNPEGGFVDIIICMRFLNWIEKDDLEKIFKKFSEMRPKYIIFDAVTTKEGYSFSSDSLPLESGGLEVEFMTLVRGGIQILRNRGIMDILRLVDRQFLRGITESGEENIVIHNKGVILSQLDEIGYRVIKVNEIFEARKMAERHVFLAQKK